MYLCHKLIGVNTQHIVRFILEVLYPIFRSKILPGGGSSEQWKFCFTISTTCSQIRGEKRPTRPTTTLLLSGSTTQQFTMELVIIICNNKNFFSASDIILSSFGKKYFFPLKKLFLDKLDNFRPPLPINSDIMFFTQH